MEPQGTCSASPLAYSSSITLHRAHHPPTGRTMEVHTTQPGIQFYTGNFLDGSLKGKGTVRYPKHSAFCLETQNWPDAVNKVSCPSSSWELLGSCGMGPQLPMSLGC